MNSLLLWPTELCGILDSSRTFKKNRVLVRGMERDRRRGKGKRVRMRMRAHKKEREERERILVSSFFFKERPQDYLCHLSFSKKDHRTHHRIFLQTISWFFCKLYSDEFKLLINLMWKFKMYFLACIFVMWQVGSMADLVVHRLHPHKYNAFHQGVFRDLKERYTRDTIPKK